MKKLMTLFLIVGMSVLIPFSVLAVGDTNVDSGGGSMGTGSDTNYWTSGRDGVRVTIVRASDGVGVSVPIDYSDESNTDIQVHFGKVSKLQYLSGTGLSITTSIYHVVQPATTMPVIISSSGNNIEEIRTYFSREGTIRDISNITGFSYDLLIGGEYKILLEPIAYVMFEGVMYAMTATEAALLNQMNSNLLRSKLVSLSHKNLPLSMFLETSELGISAWSGGTSSPQSDMDILRYLGVGIVRFSELEEEDDPTVYDVVYRCDTEVITSVYVTTSTEKTPDAPAYVTFTIDGVVYEHRDIYLPEDGSQLAWIKWRTPPTEGVITITVTSNCRVSASSIVAKIEDLDKNPPPDPQANDRNNSFTIPSVPSDTNVLSMSWGEWDCWWYAYWVDRGEWNYDGWYDGSGIWQTTPRWVSDWQDEGWYEYQWIPYTASLTATLDITPDEKVPTASGTVMKSGYGYNMQVTSSVRSSAPISQYTGLQNVVAYFPEFNYETYWRLLDRMVGGYYATFEFKNNLYSTYYQRVHFTPVWFPNGTYRVYVKTLDAWTPAGMMSVNLTDTLHISGSLFDDWHIGITK